MTDGLDDLELLRAYTAGQSERAFEALVARHIHWVYSAAFRQVRNPDLAEEITQAVFLMLARKARSFGPNTIVSAWLYRATRYVAADALKSQRRRQRREQEAQMQADGNEPEPDLWDQVAPLLDEGLAQLSERDRSALVLRFFEHKTAREIGIAQRVDESAAQKRVARALDKLRGFFLHRGVTLSAGALATLVATHSVQAASAELTLSVVAAAQGSAATASTLALAQGALKIMAWTKAKTAAVAGVVIILATGTTTMVVKHYTNPKVKAAAAIERVRQVNADLPAMQGQAKMLIFSAFTQRKIPDAARWCEDLNVGGKIWPAPNSNTVFALNSQVAGRAFSPSLPGDTVVFFEAARPGWNQTGGADLLAKRAEGVAVALADGRALIVAPDEAAQLRWQP